MWFFLLLMLCFSLKYYFYLSVRSNHSDESVLGRSLTSRGHSCHWNVKPDAPPADTIWLAATSMLRMALPPSTNRHSPLMRPTGWTSRRRAPSSGDVSFASRYVGSTSRGLTSHWGGG
jgi:hypothetical protein